MPNMARAAHLSPEQIKVWRSRLGVSQYDAAQLLGISMRTYTSYEHGEQTVSKSIALACWAIEEICQKKGPSLTLAEVQSWLNVILKDL